MKKFGHFCDLRSIQFGFADHMLDEPVHEVIRLSRNPLDQEDVPEVSGSHRYGEVSGVSNPSRRLVQANPLLSLRDDEEPDSRSDRQGFVDHELQSEDLELVAVLGLEEGRQRPVARSEGRVLSELADDRVLLFGLGRQE